MRAIPEGTYRGWAQDKQWVATKSHFNEGRSIKLVAEELGGADFISANFYDLEKGARLFPCEMSAEKVITFIREFTPDLTSVDLQTLK
ncbi:MAG: hypothetical protein HKN30_07385 [Sulfitobacter sp.]|nr:hypothetical protein [Sulfitobacter sp.]